ncbi:tripartite tricarboxylate transporter substrate-binding protein [Variovorax sp. LT1R16]|uniref:tripartite tricarboxylate transporter substrate-binding protein n=1 Tax=Variovorax sp. LT1R16 TaxID=3443728 RepID=UPI003F483C0A
MAPAARSAWRRWHAPATGNDLLLGPIGPLTINPGLYVKLPYDSEKDFDPIVKVAGTAAVLVVQPSLGVDSVPAFVSLLKVKPGKLNYGSAGNGNLTHLTSEYFLATVQAKATHVPYKGSTPAITDFLGGHLDFMFDVVPTAQPHIRSGKFKPLAVTSATRSSVLPDVPTLDELGYRGFDISSWWGLLAPRGTPQAVIDQINAEVNRGLRTAAVRDALGKLGAGPMGGTPAEFKALIHSEIGRWAQVVKASGAKVD